MLTRSFSHTNRWFLLALLPLVLFAVYTVVVASGILLYPTMYQEQWLLHRPLTGADCVLRQWGNLGDPLPTLLVVLALSALCLFLRYRPRALLYLCLLFLIGVGAEWLGKQFFAQPVPDKIYVGLTSLACPQMWKTTHMTRLELYLGMWWAAPPVSHMRVLNAYYSATTPFSFQDAQPVYGYPSGHAIRWCFIGFVACWLAWRQVRWRVLRIACMIVALLVAFGGGFAEFFIGYHLVTDLMGGYLLGISLACFAIAFLSRNERRNWKERLLPRSASSPPAQEVVTSVKSGTS
jgi:membrane-associated phospholipid phosphatase